MLGGQPPVLPVGLALPTARPDAEVQEVTADLEPVADAMVELTATFNDFKKHNDEVIRALERLFEAVQAAAEQYPSCAAHPFETRRDCNDCLNELAGLKT